MPQLQVAQLGDRNRRGARIADARSRKGNQIPPQQASVGNRYLTEQCYRNSPARDRAPSVVAASSAVALRWPAHQEVGRFLDNSLLTGITPSLQAGIICWLSRMEAEVQGRS